MGKRLFDLIAASAGLVVAAPIVALATLGIRLSTRGPAFYRTIRIGRRGRPFTMYKLRTMAASPTAEWSPVTGVDDPRVFPLGRILRRTKIDELPQLVNVLRGDMSIVGPRPEAPAFVARHYTAAQMRTLDVRPGLTSPGALYQCTHGDGILNGGDTEILYARRLLPVKLALDLVYVRRRSFWYDLAIVARTALTIAAIAAGRRRFSDPPEMSRARRLLARAPKPPPAQPAGGWLLVCCFALLVGACQLDAPGMPPLDDSAPLFVGAGDIARCEDDGDEATAAILDTLPGTVFTTGDNAYPDGSAGDYADCYAPSWGRHRDRTRPVPGNHEYHTADAAGYFAYFGVRAGEPGKGYYSYDLGEWHVIALNSELDMGADSPQHAWLRDDLAANPSLCTLAYWHHPRFSSGSTHGGSTLSEAVWEELYAAGTELVLVGHEHNYERFAPQRPDGVADPEHGLRQIVVGTGGRTTYPFGTPVANSEVRIVDTPGVLVLTLQPDGYEWRFVSTEGGSPPDAGTGVCHSAPPTALPPSASSGGHAGDAP